METHALFPEILRFKFVTLFMKHPVNRCSSFWKGVNVSDFCSVAFFSDVPRYIFFRTYCPEPFQTAPKNSYPARSSFRPQGLPGSSRAYLDLPSQFYGFQSPFRTPKDLFRAHESISELVRYFSGFSGLFWAFKILFCVRYFRTSPKSFLGLDPFQSHQDHVKPPRQWPWA